MSTSELTWFKSSCSSGSGDNCVEVAIRPATIRVRDSKAKEGPTPGPLPRRLERLRRLCRYGHCFHAMWYTVLMSPSVESMVMKLTLSGD
ncbi:DUF397 domain-containing protein [Streptomyces broussonetiae]|uniref:DUF397 domain-containing protein n=1 Tax=Streptomyces broussonetiae TaxID=2686304 RepID=UPI0035E03606